MQLKDIRTLVADDLAAGGVAAVLMAGILHFWKL